MAKCNSFEVPKFKWFTLFTRNKEKIQEFRETGDTKYIYKNVLDKACF